MMVIMNSVRDACGVDMKVLICVHRGPLNKNNVLKSASESYNTKEKRNHT